MVRSGHAWAKMATTQACASLLTAGCAATGRDPQWMRYGMFVERLASLSVQ